MEFTRYYLEQVLRKRPYLRQEWCEAVLSHPLKTRAQPDGRIQRWGFIAAECKYLRVVTLDDGVTIHNAYFDSDCEPDTQS
jgi:hypothetical protein